MPTGKFISTDWVVSVNDTALSNYAFDVQIASEKERVDVSGFSPTATREFLAGLEDQSVTVQFLQTFGTAGPYAIVQPLYESGTTFPFYVQPDSDEGNSATNPIFGGTAIVTTAPAGATLNQRAEVTYTFSPAPNSRFAWGTAAP